MCDNQGVCIMKASDINLDVSGGVGVKDGTLSLGSTISGNIGALHGAQHEHTSIGSGGYEHVQSKEECITGLYNASSSESTAVSGGTLTETRADELNIGGMEIIGRDVTTEVGPDGIEYDGDFTLCGQSFGCSCDCGCPSCGDCGLGGQVGETLAQPFVSCFGFFAPAIESLGPVLEPVGACLGSTVELAGELIECIGGLIPGD